MVLAASKTASVRVRATGRVVLAGGTFDLFHRGHIDALRQLRRYGDVVVVAVSSDRRVRQRKGAQRPILSQAERSLLVDAIRYVDFTIRMPPPSKRHPIPTLSIME